MIGIRKILAAALASLSLTACATVQSEARISEPQAVRNVVLVHGAFMDGSGWRGVWNELTARGYRVTIVQNPLTSLADDVAATRRALARQQGPVVLVGHSYGGVVITEAGDVPAVAALVYVSAFAPDVGETTRQQMAGAPPSPDFIVEAQTDGFGYVNLERFKAGFAADATDADAAFLRDAQAPLALSSSGTPLTHAAWRTRPSWYIVATQDRAIEPALQRRTAERIGAQTIEVEASHVSFLTQPSAVADVIDRAARAASQSPPAAP